jgi:hypothetical protein
MLPRKWIRQINEFTGTGHFPTQIKSENTTGYQCYVLVADPAGNNSKEKLSF